MQNPIAFKGFECPPDSFELKNLYNIPCPACSIPMLRKDQIEKFVNRVENKTGDSLITELTQYQRYYHETEAMVVEEVIIEAGRNQNLNIKQIIELLDEKSKTDFNNRVTSEIDKIRKLANNLTIQESKAFNGILDDYLNSITYGNQKIATAEELSKKLLSVVKNQQVLKKRVEKAVDKIPSQNKGKDLFYQKFANKSQAEIISRLVRPSFATCEHIKPKASGGANNTANYLIECDECNSTRNDKPFSAWSLTIPSFVENLKTYIQAISQKLENGELSSEYNTYLDDITATIAKETNGRIRLQAPKIVRAEFEEDIEQSNEKRIANFKLKLDSSRTELEQRKKEIEAFEKEPQFHLVIEYNKLIQERTELNRNIKEQERITNSRKDSLNSCYKKINEIENAKVKLSETKTEDKNFERLKSQIKKAEAFLATKNIQDIENQFEEAKNKLEELKNKLSSLNRTIASLESKIDFPKYYQDEINKKKALLSSLIEKQEKEKPTIENDSQQTLIEEIAKQEKELQQLVLENAKINTSSSTGREVVKYKHFLTLIDRITALKSINAGKLTQEDEEIYSFAQEKIKENVEQLIEENPSVQYQINLDKISKITSSIQTLYEKLERSRETLAQQKESQEKLTQYQIEIDKLKIEIDELNIKFDYIKKIFEAANSETRIMSLENEIKSKEELLQEYEKGELTQEEFLEKSSLL